MLTQVDVTSALGGLLSLTLDDSSTGLIVEDIQGLDPVKATIASTTFAGFDGSLYQSSRREFRNLVLTIALEPDFATQTVSELRKSLYAFFMPKMPVLLRFHVDGETVDIAGRVESCEAAQFVKEPKVNISIICFDPDFVAPGPIEVEGDTVNDATEFVIEYPGTVETGITLVMSVDRALTEFTIYNRTDDGVTRSLDFVANLEDLDVLTISTIPGSKKAILLRDTTESSVLYGISPQAFWIELLPGENNLRVYAEGAAIPFTITYTPRYGGL